MGSNSSIQNFVFRRSPILIVQLCNWIIDQIFEIQLGRRNGLYWHEVRRNEDFRPKITKMGSEEPIFVQKFSTPFGPTIGSPQTGPFLQISAFKLHFSAFRAFPDHFRDLDISILKFWSINQLVNQPIWSASERKVPTGTIVTWALGNHFRASNC